MTVTDTSIVVERVYGKAYQTLPDIIKDQKEPGVEEPPDESSHEDAVCPSTFKLQHVDLKVPSFRSRVQNVRGLLAVAVSALLFSLMSAGVSFVGPVFTATQTMLVRAIIQTSVAYICLVRQGLPKLGPVEVRRWVIIRGIVGASNNWIMFFAVMQIPIGDAMTIIFTGPLFTVIFACLFFGDPFLWLELAAVLTSIAGVVLVSRPPFLFSGQHAELATDTTAPMLPRWIIACLCSFGAFLNGLIPLIVRHIGKAAHWLSLVFSFSLCGMMMSGLALVIGVEETRWPALRNVGIRPYSILLMIGLLATSAQSLFNYGLQLEKPATAAITRQLDVPFCFFLQVILFGDAVHLLSAIGAALVLGSSSVVLGRRLFCSPKEVYDAPAQEAADFGDDAVCDASDGKKYESGNDAEKECCSKRECEDEGHSTR